MDGLSACHGGPADLKATLALLVLSVVAVGLDSVVLNGNFDSHGTFTSVFLTHLSSESRDTADYENEFRKQRRKSEVMKDCGQSAIDVNRKWLDQLARDRLHCGNEFDAFAWESSLTRHSEQERRSRVFQVDAVP